MKSLVPASVTVALTLVVALTVGACSTQETASSAERVAPEVKTVRLYVFDCGTLQADPARFRLKKKRSPRRACLCLFPGRTPAGTADVGSRAPCLCGLDTDGR